MTPHRQRYACEPCEVLQTSTFLPVCFCCGLPMIPASQLPPRSQFVPYRSALVTYP